ncbi:MAG: ATP-dependent sacrificial sulfur transferase LarE [Candidatus Zixiibacteriota bacterium]
MAPLNSELKNKYDRLLETISGYGKAVVAFSGGLDSGFVVYAAVKAIGRENVLAVTADSESLARDDKDYAANFVKTIGIPDRHRAIRTNELADENYASNKSDRCFFCKHELFSKLEKFALENDYDCVLDGANASDIGDHRPGQRAARNHAVKSPLLDVGLNKDEIREIARSEGLEIWDKPQAACLASRIPYGDRVTPEKLAMVEKAERVLRECGFRQMRVRHHGKIARIEIEEKDIERFVEPQLRQRISEEFRGIGFLWVTLDLKAFKTGSMNIMIEDGRRE